MPKSSSSKRWLQRQEKDHYVQQAKKEGYRSRAAYKLLELNDKYRVIKPGMKVVDLGAAPGGWSQVAVKLVGRNGKLIALDVLDMPSISGVQFIQGDFTEEEVYQSLLNLLSGEKVDVILSDMAPNISGIRSVDIPKSMYLVELAMEFADQTLKTGGTLLMKAFHGEGFEDIVKQLRQNFTTVKIRKPEASRKESREVYLVAMGFLSASSSLLRQS